MSLKGMERPLPSEAASTTAGGGHWLRRSFADSSAASITPDSRSCRITEEKSLNTNSSHCPLLSCVPEDLGVGRVLS